MDLSSFIAVPRERIGAQSLDQFEALLKSLGAGKELMAAIDAIQRKQFGWNLISRYKQLICQAAERLTDLCLQPVRAQCPGMGSITEDAKKRHLFPYDTNQEHWTGEDLKGETPDAVAQSFRTIAIEALGGLQKILVDSELELYLNHEVGFVRAVVEFYDQLKDLNKPVVFWDVDETLGSSEANFSTSSSTEWRFRLSAAPLFRFLQEQYPEVQNGILTSRAYSILPLQMTSVDFLGCLGSAINRELVFSSRDIYELLANSGSSALREDLARNVLSNDFLTIDSLISKPAALAKVLALHQLMSIYQNNTLHLIDDLEIHVPEAWTGRVLSSAVAEAVRSCGRL